MTVTKSPDLKLETFPSDKFENKSLPVKPAPTVALDRSIRPDAEISVPKTSNLTKVGIACTFPEASINRLNCVADIRNLTSSDEGSTNRPTLSLLFTIPPETRETLLKVPSNSALTSVFCNFLSALAKANSLSHNSTLSLAKS